MRGNFLFRRLLVWPLAAAAAFAAEPAPPDVTQAAGDFYQAHAAARFTGLPDGRQLAAIESRLSAALRKALRTAIQRQAACIKAHPDDKPPWAEGDLFSSNFEGFTRFRLPLEADRAGTARWILDIAFEYAAPGEAQSFSWHDRAVVVREGGRWVLDDVLYRTAGKGRFTSGYGSGLRRALDADPGCGKR